MDNSVKGTITGLFATPRARIAPGVVYLRNADAALHLKELVPEAKNVIVAGEQTSEDFLNAHRERGLNVRLEAQIDEILPDDNGHVKGQKQELAGINHGVTVERLTNYPRVQSLRTPTCECRCGWAA